MRFLKRAWRGEEKLWKVFWVYGAGGAILPLIIACYSSFYILHHIVPQLWVVAPSLAVILGFFIYFIGWGVLLWKCLGNEKIKFFVILTVLYYLVVCIPVFFACGLFVWGITEINILHPDKYAGEEYDCDYCKHSADSGCIEQINTCIFRISEPHSVRKLQ